MRILLLTLILITNTFVNAQDFLWAKYDRTSTNDKSRAIVYDQSGFVYIVGVNGYFTGSQSEFVAKYRVSDGVNIWKITPGTDAEDIKLDNNNNLVIFGSNSLKKIDPSGNLIWSKSIIINGSGNSCFGKRLGIDEQDNIYLFGKFHGTINFGGLSLNEDGGTYPNQNSFLAKYNSNGTVNWVVKCAGEQLLSSSFPTGLSVKNNEIVISGIMKDISHFDNIAIGSANTQSAYVAKYDTSGTAIWAKDLGYDIYSGSNICVDNNKNIYYTGVDGSNIVTDKLDSNGTQIWHNSTISGGGNAYGICVDTLGNCYISGKYYNGTDFGDGIVPTASQSANNGTDMFIAKYNNLGMLAWVQHAGGGSNSDVANDITLDKNGHLYVTGEYISDATFGNITLTSLSGLQTEIFITKMDGVFPSISVAPFGGTDPTQYSTGHYCQRNIVLNSLDNFAPVTYQWYKNGIAILGEVNSSYQVPAGLTGIGNYQVEGIIDSTHNNLSDWFPVDSTTLVYNIDSTAVCNIGASNGSISISNWNGGANPYQFQIDTNGYGWATSFNNLTTGTYLISVQDGNTCVSSKYVTVEEYPTPILNLGNDTTLCDGSTLILDVTFSGATYLWQDGSVNATFTIHEPGEYKVFSTFGTCTISDSITIVNTNSADYSIVNIGLGDYYFFNNSTGVYNQSHWAFGDGTTSSTSAMNSNHTFTTNGVFVVVLTINDSSNGGSCTDFFYDTVTVTDVQIPLQCSAGFVMIPDTLTGDITLINSSTGANMSYFWDFGDGSTSTQQFPSHTYVSSGPFYICLTVDDGSGCIDMYCDSIGGNGVVFKQGGFTINVTPSTPIITDIGIIDLNLEVEIYPNPTSNQLTIDTKLEISNIKIIDLSGKIIKTITTDLNIVNVSDLSDGIYFIKFITDEKTITRKFVKQ